MSSVQPRPHMLKSGLALLIREAAPEDAGAVLAHIEAISGETDLLGLGPGEFEPTQEEEARILSAYRVADNQLYLLGLIGDALVSTLAFSAGHRPRLRHVGEFSLGVRRRYWGLGIGSLMLDTLIAWARDGEIVTKINLRVRTDNERAIRLYKRKGFVKEGTVRRAILLNGTYYDHDCMGMEL